MHACDGDGGDGGDGGGGGDDGVDGDGGVDGGDVVVSSHTQITERQGTAMY